MTFDIVFSNHVLEHIEDDKKAMSELFRVLKPSGMGVFQIPQDYTFPMYHFYMALSSLEW